MEKRGKKDCTPMGEGKTKDEVARWKKEETVDTDINREEKRQERETENQPIEDEENFRPKVKEERKGKEKDGKPHVLNVCNSDYC